jgi:hypothetical protein
MAAKLGSGDVSFRLGAGEVAAVYLGSQEVWSAVVPATLYFDGAVDDAWTTVGNWWLDASHTQAAGRLPTSDESVVATVGLTASGQTVANFTLGDVDRRLGGTLTVTGAATFTEGSINEATVTGNATFTEGSYNGGTVTGNATFNDFSSNGGTVTGTATFTGSACNDGGTAGTFVPDPPPSC